MTSVQVQRALGALSDLIDADPKAAWLKGTGLLQVGSTGDEVSSLQSFLTQAGLMNGGFTPGTYDEVTAASVQALQGQVGAAVDGIVGAETRGKTAATLAKALAQRASPPSKVPAALMIFGLGVLGAVFLWPRG